MYSRVYHGDTLLSIGCEVTCVKVAIVCELLPFTYSPKFSIPV